MYYIINIYRHIMYAHAMIVNSNSGRSVLQPLGVMYSSSTIQRTSVFWETPLTTSAVVMKEWLVSLVRSACNALANDGLPWPSVIFTWKRLLRTAVALYSFKFFLSSDSASLHPAVSLAWRSRAFLLELQGPQIHFTERALPMFVRCSLVPHSIQQQGPVATESWRLGVRRTEEESLAREWA